MKNKFKIHQNDSDRGAEEVKLKFFIQLECIIPIKLMISANTGKLILCINTDMQFFDILTKLDGSWVSIGKVCGQGILFSH